MMWCISSSLLWISVCICTCVGFFHIDHSLQYDDTLSMIGDTLSMDGDTVTVDNARARISRSISDETSGPAYFDLWKEILFPENETVWSVDVYDSHEDVISAGSVCVYVPEHSHEVKNNTATINFHCARGHSQPCLHNGVCDNKHCRRPGGICNCSNTEGFEGVNCGIKTAMINGAGCPLGCVNGLCVSDGWTAHCKCDPGFTGHLCDKKAYYHECTPHGFSICITPFSVDTFWGDIYVNKYKHIPGCSLKRAPTHQYPGDGILDWCKGYIANINFNGACGSLGPSFNDNMTKFELKLTVQYAKKIVTCTDEVVTLICQYNTHSLLLYKTLYLDTGGLQHVQEETVQFSPVYLIMTSSDGGHLFPPLPVGYKVNMCIVISGVTGFHGVIINNIIMNNTRTGDDFREMVVYEEGCVHSSLSSVVSVLPHWTNPQDKSRVCLQFKIFFFDHDLNITHVSLGVVADVSVFTDPADAVVHQCGSRKKRQAVDEETKTVVGTTITINITAPEIESFDEIVSDKPGRPWFMPVVGSVGAIAAIFCAVILSVAVVRCIQRQRKDVP